MACRNCTHAGSWYSAEAGALDAELEGYLAEARPRPRPGVRAVIAPHAGFRFSGPTAGHAYGVLDASAVSRVFVLGPSHKVYLDGCALSPCASLETPLGPLAVDAATQAELLRSGAFETMSQETDENEHSIEMHLPFIRAALGAEATVVPVLVGALSAEAEARYGELLAPFLQDPGTLFVVSSDFCHWGKRFDYRPEDRRGNLPIHAFIETMDRQGMQLIEGGDPAAFRAYLQKTRNTICGRHPIMVLLHAMRRSGLRLETEFTHYAQSGACTERSDSSVSYAAGVVVCEAPGSPAT